MKTAKHISLSLLTLAAFTSIGFSADTKAAADTKAPAETKATAETRTHTKSTAKARDAKPADSKGWVVYEDDFYVPFRFAAFDWLTDAGVSYRASEEKAAANKLDLASSWLWVTSTHALPETKTSLQEASNDLKTLSTDIRAGKTIEAAHMKTSLEKANAALANWHYMEAEKNQADKDEVNAVQNLQAASRYLKAAADSATYNYGSDFVTTYDLLTGWTITDAVPNSLTAHLSTVHTELDKLAATLNKVDK